MRAVSINKANKVKDEKKGSAVRSERTRAEARPRTPKAPSPKQEEQGSLRRRRLVARTTTRMVHRVPTSYSYSHCTLSLAQAHPVLPRHTLQVSSQSLEPHKTRPARFWGLYAPRHSHRSSCSYTVLYVVMAHASSCLLLFVYRSGDSELVCSQQLRPVAAARGGPRVGLPPWSEPTGFHSKLQNLGCLAPFATATG